MYETMKHARPTMTQHCAALKTIAKVHLGLLAYKPSCS